MEDTRNLFDELFGSDGSVEVEAPTAVPVSEVLAGYTGSATVATSPVARSAGEAGASRARGAQSVVEADPAGRASLSEADQAEFWGGPAPRVEAAADRPRGRVRVRARKVRRIIRHVEVWSVLKVSLFFFLTLWLILLLSGVMVWSVAVNSGGIDSVEDFIEKLMGYEEFDFLPEQIFRAYAIGGLVVCVGLSAFSVVVTMIFNLISDLMGGIRVTVIEEERIRR